jgi:hemerythrin
MEWTAAFSLGIEEIDRQHKELLRLFSMIEEAIAKDEGWSAIHYGLVEVKNIAQFHFRFEEALMRLYGFPGLTDHGEAHQAIMQKLTATEQESLQSDAKQEMLKFFRDWLFSHIRDDDRAYAEFILGGARVVTAGESESG